MRTARIVPHTYWYLEEDRPSTGKGLYRLAGWTWAFSAERPRLEELA
jgi:hypothetical protein